MSTQLTKTIIRKLKKESIPEKAEFFPKFFKAFPGGYGEGDFFLGVPIPPQRSIAKQYAQKVSLSDIEILLNNKYHEVRMTGLFLLVYKFQKEKDPSKRKELVDFYLDHTYAVNNWDLVDSSAAEIVGTYFYEIQDPEVLFNLSHSKNLWEQRIAVIGSYPFIKNGQFDVTLKLSQKLLNHEHDLLHKAVGWMLREVGKKDETILKKFLKKYYKNMPRTMLRYAIEKFDKKTRQKYLHGEI